MGGGVVLMLPCPPEAEPKLQSRQRRKGQTGSEVRGGFFLGGGRIAWPPVPPTPNPPPVIPQGEENEDQGSSEERYGEGGGTVRWAGGSGGGHGPISPLCLPFPPPPQPQKQWDFGCPTAPPSTAAGSRLPAGKGGGVWGGVVVGCSLFAGGLFWGEAPWREDGGLCVGMSAGGCVGGGGALFTAPIIIGGGVSRWRPHPHSPTPSGRTTSG